MFCSGQEELFCGQRDGPVGYDSQQRTVGGDQEGCDTGGGHADSAARRADPATPGCAGRFDAEPGIWRAVTGVFAVIGLAVLASLVFAPG
jgi:hypothetical protein